MRSNRGNRTGETEGRGKGQGRRKETATRQKNGLSQSPSGINSLLSPAGGSAEL